MLHPSENNYRLTHLVNRRPFAQTTLDGSKFVARHPFTVALGFQLQHSQDKHKENMNRVCHPRSNNMGLLSVIKYGDVVLCSLVVYTGMFLLAASSVVGLWWKWQPTGRTEWKWRRRKANVEAETVILCRFKVG